MFSGNLKTYKTGKLSHKVKIICLTSIAVTDWQFHNQQRSKVPNHRDFRKLNKLSLRNKVVTAHEQYEFRESCDARIPIGMPSQLSNRLPDASFAYGKRNRPPTPVANVMNNVYGLQGAAYQEHKRYKSSELNQRNNRLQGIRMTAAQKLMDDAVR